MNGKVYTLRPNIAYKHQSKVKAENLTEKEKLIDWLENFLLLVLTIVFLLLSIGVAYKSFILIKMQSEKRTLLAEKKMLKEEIKRLTSREIVLEKAKVLGLRPPKEEDIIKLK